MSGIVFQSLSGAASISRRERAYAGLLCSDMTYTVLGSLHSSDPSGATIKPFLPQNLYLQTTDASQFQQAFAAWLCTCSERDHFIVDGEMVSVFGLVLNTALRLGSDPVKLLARMHGQCETHAWIRGVNRKWVADIIRDGLRDAILREDMGWEKLEIFLRENSAEDVVLSYDGSNDFPSRYLAKQAGWVSTSENGTGDDWYDLSHDKQWVWSMTYLYDNAHWLEIAPGRWQRFYFDSGLTAFDLRQRIALMQEGGVYVYQKTT